ncbi:Hypothetical predicted protein [Pelobates cultripes]|uniref:Microtubule-associated tumor suppressor candidate 2 n=1 Tax=Pelobates cultripes TaxID=61616 RepID=A0AAD1R6T4_PELCU|nr:Hypothetical predicted protein [Pelobates cultripes]
MSTSLVPNKSCCTKQQDNSNEDQNDNESEASLGDSNANQIFPGTRTRDQVEVSSNVVKTEIFSNWKTENLHSTSLHYGLESPGRGLSLSDSRPHSPTNKDLNKGYMTDDTKESLKPHIPHVQTQLNIKSNSHDRSLLIPLNRACDSSFGTYSNNTGNISPSERFKGLSLAKSGIPSTKSESFVKDHISPSPLLDSPSKYVQSIEPSNYGIRANTDASAPVDRLYGLLSHTLNNTSEEKKIVFYSKPPTSDANFSEFPSGERIISQMNKQSTSQHPSNTDHHSRLTLKPQEISSIAEAQFYQGQVNIPSELIDAKYTQTKGIGLHRADHILPTDMAGSKREHMSVTPFSPPCGLMSRSQSNRALKQGDTFLCSSPIIPDSNKSAIKHDENAGDTLHNEPKIQYSQDCDHPDTNSHVMGSLKNKESLSKPVIRKITSFSEPLENKTYLNKDRASDDYIYQGGDTNTFSSSHMTSLKDKTSLVESKKTVVGRKHQTDVLKGNMKECHKDSADYFIRPPTPSSPVTAVNINDQRTASPSNIKDFSTAHVDRLSPSTVLPPTESTQLFNISPKATSKTLCNSGIPKPILIHSKTSTANQGDVESNCNEKTEEPVEAGHTGLTLSLPIESSLIVPKPKHVRPKIITYIRRNPQAVDRIPFGQMSIPFGAPTCTTPIPKEHEILSSDGKTSSTLLDKYKADIQKPRLFSAGLMVSGIQPPGHHSLEETGDRSRKDDFSSPFAHYEVPPSFYRSTMILKPQLGLGAVSRLPSAKSRILIASQRSSSSSITQQDHLRATGSVNNTDISEDVKKDSITNGAKSNLPKPCQPSLRPPGYSRLPAGKLAAFGFVRSSSVSSLSSNQSNESIQSDHNRALNAGTSFANEEQCTQKTTLPSRDMPKGTSRTVLQVCSSTAVPRRSLLPSPKTTISPAGSKKDTSKEQDIIKPTISSPKRQVSSTTKQHSPGHHHKVRPTTSKNGYAAKPEIQTRESERQGMQKLKEKYDEQSKKLLVVQEELKKASCGFVVFAVTTQYFFKKNEVCLMKEKELAVELATIRDEVANNTAHCEKLQKEKEELEIKFDNEVRKLERLQQEELQVLKERLQVQSNEEMEHLREEQIIQLTRLRSQHQEQIENLGAVHESTLSELKYNHSTAINSMHDDHERRVHELKESHEYEKKLIEDSFEKLRLSLQDQVDTLTFQNHSLRDRAKRFEEALMKNTNEQFEIALAPYRHLDEDLNSVKQVLEIKNQLIHQQEKRIMELEKLAEINVILEERIQVLQQQNEDLKARIDQNVAVTRQLSAENANLHESVEKESKEKKRLSRTNEELVWKLQTAESMSPVKMPSSPIKQSTSGPLSPAKVSSSPR